MILIDVVKGIRSVTLGAISSTTPHADRCHLTNDEIRSHNGAADLRQGAILGHNSPELETSGKKTRLARYGLLTRGAKEGPYNSGLASSASRAR